jgi:hypothetical protein
VSGPTGGTVAERAVAGGAVQAILVFAAVNAVIIALLAWVLGLLFTGAAGRHAILVSAWVAFGVQLVTFVLLRTAARSSVITAWGTGALLRFLVLGVYGLVVVRALGLDMAAALLSLAAFFFISTLVEPLLLKT